MGLNLLPCRLLYYFQSLHILFNTRINLDLMRRTQLIAYSGLISEYFAFEHMVKAHLWKIVHVKSEHCSIYVLQ